MERVVGGRWVAAGGGGKRKKGGGNLSNLAFIVHRLSAGLDLCCVRRERRRKEEKRRDERAQSGKGGKGKGEGEKRKAEKSFCRPTDREGKEEGSMVFSASTTSADGGHHRLEPEPALLGLLE